MATVSGKTYDHREYLKTVANWNAARKVWVLPDSATDYIAAIRALVGCVVTLDGDKPSQPVEREPVASTVEGSTTFYGSDRDYYNSFAHKNPQVFAGFNSLGELCDFVGNIPGKTFSESDNRNRGWQYDDTGWFGSANMTAALRIAREGWIDGVEKAKRALEVIETDHPTTRQRTYSVAGGRVNVGKMLTGNPVHMSKRPRQPAQKVITLFVELVMSSSITPENSIIRAASIAAMCDQLEHANYSCEIVGVMTISRDQHYGPALAHFTVKLKQAGEVLNLNDFVFALGHPSMLRRFGFALMAVNPALERHWHGMGKIDEAFTDDYPTDASAFYIEQLLTSQQVAIKGEFTDKVRALFPLIVPDNFPVTLK